VTLEAVNDKFGTAVAVTVHELTNPSKGSTAPRAERKRWDCGHIAKAPLWTRKIKAIDRIDNLREMEGCNSGFLATSEFLSLYKRESANLADALALGSVDESLGKLIAELRELIQQ
jgi:(p)ppGpp synthase/HD superfamily hydrolase